MKSLKSLTRRQFLKPAVAASSVLLLEASGRVGGRAQTDTAHFGVPFDRGH